MERSTTSARVTTTLERSTSSSTRRSRPPPTDALLDADRATLSDAAASGDFCTAYGAYDLLASRTDDPTSPEAVAIFRLGFEATTGITPLVPEEIEGSWSTFVFGAGLIDQAVAETGTTPRRSATWTPRWIVSGITKRGDDVTRWYLEHCG